MINFRNALLAAGAALLFASPALAASSTAVSATATTYAQIVDPLTITKNKDLSFGTLVKTAALTTTPVTVTLNGLDTVTCPAALLCSGAPTSAKFTVTGTDGQTVYLTTVATSSSSTVSRIPSEVKTTRAKRHRECSRARPT